jgi:hypothetical protein
MNFGQVVVHGSRDLPEGEVICLLGGSAG